MSILNSYNARMNFIDTDKGERIKKRMDHRIRRTFESDPSYFLLQALEPDGTTSSEKKVQILNLDYVKNINYARINSRFFISHPDTPVENGTILFNLYEKDWLVVSSHNLIDLNYNGVVRQSNYIAKWYDNFQMVELMGIVSNLSQRSGGTIENNFLTLPHSMIELIFSKNEISKKLKRDQRLMVYDTPYKITKVDTFTDDNLIFLLAEEDEFKNDNEKETGICDPPSNLEAGIAGKSFLPFGSFTTYEAINATGAPVWSIIQGNDFIGAHQINEDDIRKYDLILKRDSNLIGKQIILQAIFNNETYEKIITISSLS